MQGSRASTSTSITTLTLRNESPVLRTGRPLVHLDGLLVEGLLVHLDVLPESLYEGHLRVGQGRTRVVHPNDVLHDGTLVGGLVDADATGKGLHSAVHSVVLAEIVNVRKAGAATVVPTGELHRWGHLLRFLPSNSNWMMMTMMEF